MRPAGVEQPAKPVIVRAGADQAPGAGQTVAGLTVIDRACKQLRRNGHAVIIATDGLCPLPDPLPAGTEVRNVASDGEITALADALGGTRVVGADVVRPSNRGLDGGIRVTDPASRGRAEDAVFAELLRGDLGLVARHLNKPISFRLTRYLFCRLPFTPNQVTVAAGLIGAVGALLVATGHRAWGLLGFLLAHLQSVLDGCDGELARVRFQQSDIGEWLDTVVDDALNLLLFAAVGVGCWQSSGSQLDLAIGLGSVLAMLTYNVVAYRELIRQGDGGEVLKVKWWFAGGGTLKGMYDRSRLSPSRALMALGRRDFFLFAWLVLAVLGWNRVILTYAAMLAAASLFAAVGQMVWRWSRPNRSR